MNVHRLRFDRRAALPVVVNLIADFCLVIYIFRAAGPALDSVTTYRATVPIVLAGVTLGFALVLA